MKTNIIKPYFSKIYNNLYTTLIVGIFFCVGCTTEQAEEEPEETNFSTYECLNGGCEGVSDGSFTSLSACREFCETSGNSGGSNTKETVKVLFVLDHEHQGHSLECTLPVAMEVHEGSGTFDYCQSGNNYCRPCGASYESFFLGSGESYGKQEVNLLAGSSNSCESSGAGVYYLPPGQYTYEWESPVCVPDYFFETNTKRIHLSGSLYISSSDLEKNCIIKTMGIQGNSFPSVVNDWIINNCDFD